VLGTQVSHYRILELVGEGGMGRVYKAQDLTLDRVVAIKVLKSDRTDESQRSFLREAQAISRIHHASVVTIYEVIEDAGTTCLVMQFVEGMSLRDRLDRDPPGLEEALGIACCVGAGLRAAHEIGVVHRDLKPENVMVEPGGQCRVLDFGIARLANRSTLREKGKLFGTLPYMAPEQIQGQETDARTDVYGLGVLLYEMLTGTRPFVSKEEVPLLYDILNSDPASPEQHRSGLPPGLDRIVMQALRKKPGDRYSDVAAMLHDLEIVRAEIRAQPKRPEKLLAKAAPRRWLKATVAGVVLGAIGIAVAMRLLAPGEPRVLIARWTVEPELEDLGWLSNGVMDCMIRALAGRDGFHVISRQTVSSLNQTLASRPTPGTTAPMSAAHRMGAAYLVSGNVERNGGRLRLTCELASVSQGVVVGSWSADLTDVRRELYPALDQLALAVSGALEQRTRRPSRTEPPRVMLSQSIDALKSYQLAFEARELGDFTAALDWLDDALEYDSTFADAHLLAARMSPEEGIKQRHMAMAMKYRFKASPKTRLLIEAAHFSARNDYRGALEKYEAVLAMDPEDVIARASLARLYVHRRQFSEAVSEYLVLHGLNPFDYSYYPWWAAAYVEAGRSDRAVEILAEWRRSFPQEPAPLVELIATYRSQGDFDAALTLCDTLDSVRPGSAGPHRGFLFMELGRLHEAEREFERSRSLGYRDTLRLNTYLALLAHRRKDYSRGLALVEPALTRDSDPYTLWVAGLLAAGAGDLEKARARLRTIESFLEAPGDDSTTVEAYSSRRFYYHLMAEIEMERGRSELAVGLFSRALRYAGRADDPYFRTHLGSALIESGNLAQAVRELEHVLSINPNYPEALLELGRANVLMGKPQAARRSFDRLLTLWRNADGDDPMNREFRKLMANLSHADAGPAEFRAASETVPTGGRHACRSLHRAAALENVERWRGRVAVSRGHHRKHAAHPNHQRRYAHRRDPGGHLRHPGIGLG